MSILNRLIVIYYHEIVKDGEGSSYQKLDISKFEEQMKYLNRQGFHSFLFSDISAGIPEKAIIVSFDDGFRSVYQNAVPIMKKYGIKGNVYLPTAYIGVEQEFMNWEMVEKMYSTGDWYFAAHTHNHVDIRSLTRVQVEEEVNKSRKEFQKHLGYVPRAFCIPYGTFNNRSIKLIKATGNYKYILGSFYGFGETGRLEKDVLPRIGISNDDTMDIFRNKLEGKLNWKGPLQKTRLMIQNIRGERVEQYDY